MNNEVKAGLYRHFKGNYYFVTGVLQNAEDEKSHMVIYFNALQPENGTYMRPLESFIATHEEDGRVIKERPDNITGQSMRFERVTELS